MTPCHRKGGNPLPPPQEVGRLSEVLGVQSERVMKVVYSSIGVPGRYAEVRGVSHRSDKSRKTAGSAGLFDLNMDESDGENFWLVKDTAAYFFFFYVYRFMTLLDGIKGSLCVLMLSRSPPFITLLVSVLCSSPFQPTPDHHRKILRWTGKALIPPSPSASNRALTLSNSSKVLLDSQRIEHYSNRGSLAGMNMHIDEQETSSYHSPCRHRDQRNATDLETSALGKPLSLHPLLLEPLPIQSSYDLR